MLNLHAETYVIFYSAILLLLSTVLLRTPQMHSPVYAQSICHLHQQQLAQILKTPLLLLLLSNRHHLLLRKPSLSASQQLKKLLNASVTPE